MVSAGAREGASPPRELRWMRRIIAHPVADAVVYGVCGAMWALNGGLALGVLGHRAGGAMGARLVSAGNSAASVAIWPFLLAPLAAYLYGLRAAVSAMESDDPPAPRRRPAASTGEMLCMVLGYLVKDVVKLASLLSLGAVGFWVVKCSLVKGSLQEKATITLTGGSINTFLGPVKDPSGFYKTNTIPQVVAWSNKNHVMFCNVLSF